MKKVKKNIRVLLNVKKICKKIKLEENRILLYTRGGRRRRKHIFDDTFHLVNSFLMNFHILQQKKNKINFRR